MDDMRPEKELFLMRVGGWHMPLFQARGRSMISEHAIDRLVCGFVPSFRHACDLATSQDGIGCMIITRVDDIYKCQYKEARNKLEMN